MRSIGHSVDSQHIVLLYLSEVELISKDENSDSKNVLYKPAVAYPELVSRGVSKSRKCKWLVKIGASYGVTPLNKKSWPGGGVPCNQKTPWIRH